MFETKVVEKITTYILCTIIFLFSENHTYYGSVERYGRARQATDSIMRRTRFGCRVTKARIQTPAEYFIPIALPR